MECPIKAVCGIVKLSLMAHSYFRTMQNLTHFYVVTQYSDISQSGLC